MSQAKDRPFPCSMYKENFDKNTENTRFKRLLTETTPPVRGPPREQEDSQRRNYTVLPLCPMTAVAVTTATVPVLSRGRLVRSRLILVIFILVIFILVIFTSVDKKKAQNVLLLCL